METAVAIDTWQRAKRNKATAEEEERTTPPSPRPAAAVRRPRQPTPDHPPYCWMIGEAIDALREDGGSSVGAISSFVRAAHPGVPAAHDVFLRHYLAKHVAEGIFACTAPDRYARVPDESAAVEAPVEPASAGTSEAVRVGTPVAQVKRGRVQPGKDGSSSMPPAGKKDDRAESATPKSQGRPYGVARPAAGHGFVPTSSVAAAPDKDEIYGTSTAPKRSSQAWELALVDADDGPVPVLVADKTDGGEAPFAMDKRLQQSRKASPVVIDSQGSAPTSGNKARGKTLSATFNAKGHRRQGKLALPATGAHSSPTSVTGNRAPSVAPKPHGQPIKLYPLTSEETPDDPSLCLLALPAAANACWQP